MLQAVVILCSARTAKSSNFQAHHLNFKIVFFGYFAFQAFEGWGGKLFDRAAAEASKMKVVLLGSDLVVVFFAVQMHEIQFVDKT